MNMFRPCRTGPDAVPIWTCFWYAVRNLKREYIAVCFSFYGLIDRMKEKNQDYEEAAGVQQQQSVQILTVIK